MILHTHDPVGRLVRTERGEMLYFSGTSYLALPTHIAFRQLLVEGMERYGNNFGGSRTANLRLSVYEEAEQFWQEYAGAEKAILLSSGFMAGQLIAWWLRQQVAEQPATVVAYAPNTHQALWSGLERYSDETFQDWLLGVVKHIAATPQRRFVLVCNALDSVKAELYDFSPLAKLPASAKVTLIADDSHGIGITGPSGKGIFPVLRQFSQLQIVVVASLAKACGLAAGLILTDAHCGKLLTCNPFFAGASPCMPACAYAMMRATNIWQQQRAKLLENIAFAAQKLAPLGIFNFTTDYPVFYTAEQGLYEFLLARGILISAFPYPKIDGPVVTRVVISAAHTKDDITLLAEQVSAFVAQQQQLGFSHYAN
ncbi:MAG: aminotransferase class I/II-fold pyridoxal phosphate-dependent enzyme [Cytophagales bacterium]|nr:aminotransferase class I/II-fold pyridoxal phosphate-dependent enzyme [Bernardetiaceae bacterium]MDW8204090.1 aminotransferase class I/II-fold pyridoxal phosphate-dependent enzyme [Cytophagales bacterium]